MRQAGRLAAGALVIGLATAPARAEVTAEQAAGLQAALRGWVSGLLAPLVEAAAVPLTLTAQGERYRAELGAGFTAIPGVTITSGGVTTAFLRKLDGTRWAVEEFRFPQDFSAAIDFGTGSSGTGNYTLHIAEQAVHGEIDPGLATPTRFEGKLGGLTQAVNGPHGPQTTRMAQLGFDATWTPSGPAGGSIMDAASNSSVEGYSTEHDTAVGHLAYSAARLRTSVKAEGVDFARLQAALRSAMTLGDSVRAEIKGGAPAAVPSPAQRAAMHALLEAVAGAFTRVQGTEGLSKLHFAFGDTTGDLAAAELSAALGAPDGNAEFRLRVAAEGLESPMIPRGTMHDLVPRRLVLAPRVSGVPKASLVGFLAHAIDVAGDANADLEDEAMQLLANNPVTVAVDELVVELAVARLSGHGQLQAASPAEVQGTAELRMTGLDPLIRLLGQSPDTKPAVAVAVILKGIGKVEGNETVWRIAYADGKATVNGTDLSSLVPGRR